MSVLAVGAKTEFVSIFYPIRFLVIGDQIWCIEVEAAHEILLIGMIFHKWIQLHEMLEF